MDDEKKTKKQMIEELNELRQCVAELKGFEEEIKQTRVNQEKFTKAFLQNSIPISITTLKEGRFVDVNNAFLSLMKCKRDEVVGHTATEIGFITEEQRVIFFNELNKRGRVENLEMKVRTKGGVLKHGLFNAVMLGINNENCLLTVMIDITNRKREELYLQKSREQYKSLYGLIRRMCDNVPDMIWAKDCSNCFTFTNKAICENLLNATDTEEPLGKWDMYFAERERNAHPDQPDWHTFGEICADSDTVVMTSKQAERFEEFGNVKGQFLSLDVYKAPFYDEEGKMIGTVGCGRDITCEKQLEKKHREAEEKYQSIFENAVEGIFQTTPDGRILSANPALASIFGYESPEELMASVTDIGRQLYVSNEAREEFLRLVDEKGLVKGFETQMHRKDGSICWVSINTRSLKNDVGKTMFYEGFAVDITCRKRAEAEKEKIEHLNHQLQKLESLGRMAGAIAHHFNNKLGVVIGNLDMALGKLPRGVEFIEHLTAAMQAAGKAAEVSGLMLTYLGQMPGKRAPLDISEVCRSLLAILLAAIPGKVSLETDLPSPGPVISANVNQIQQVLTNLVTNAWEAVGEDGGTIHLRVKTGSPADIPAAYRFPQNWQSQDTAYACLEVADTGCGIADKDIENLFDPFFSSKFTGRGLGLPVILGIVRTYGGVITVESEPGIGSAFRVFFPVSVEEVPRQPYREAQAPEMEGGGAVLLVEDEEMVRTMAKRMLTRLGFTVLEAKDGVEAVEVFRQRQERIRCVLCDLTMPRMNGWETLTALRKLAPGIPVILSSGYDKAHVMAGDHPELPQVFLGKPYKLKGLRNAIGEALLVSKKK